MGTGRLIGILAVGLVVLVAFQSMPSCASPGGAQLASCEVVSCGCCDEPGLASSGAHCTCISQPPKPPLLSLSGSHTSTPVVAVRIPPWQPAVPESFDWLRLVEARGKRLILSSYSYSLRAPPTV